jgi:hypothetical protein
MCGGGTPTNEGMSCMNGNACQTNDKCMNGSCVGTPVTACLDNDGCCPPGCTLANDNDCNCMVNVALGATPLTSGGGSVPPHTPAEMNNGIGKSNCAAFAWINNGTTPTAAFFELDWAMPVTIGSFYIEAAEANGTGQCPMISGRNIASADVQTWNGSTWVTALSFSGKSGDVQINIQPSVTTTKLRLFNVTSSPGNGNSLMFEWHVFGAPNCTPAPD